MKVVYARQALPEKNSRGLVPNSIFLVGPTPRAPKPLTWWQQVLVALRLRKAPQMVPSWRPEALERLKALRFDGTVFVPEDEGAWVLDEAGYMSQVWWEIEALGAATAVAAWMDRRLPEMPAFTTNTELGLLLMAKPDRLVLGVPAGAEKVRYQCELAGNVERLHDLIGGDTVSPVKKVPVYATMETMLARAVEMAYW